MHGVLLREVSVVAVILLLPANDKQARAGGLHNLLNSTYQEVLWRQRQFALTVSNTFCIYKIDLKYFKTCHVPGSVYLCQNCEIINNYCNVQEYTDIYCFLYFSVHRRSSRLHLCGGLSLILCYTVPNRSDPMYRRLKQCSAVANMKLSAVSKYFLHLLAAP